MWIAGALLICATALAVFWAFNAGPPSARTSEPPCNPVMFEGQRFTVCQIDTVRQDLRLVMSNRANVALRNFAALKAFLGHDAVRVRFAINAGMYDADGRPIGLYVEDGVLVRAANTKDGAGNFHLKPNGVFSVDGHGRARVETTETYLDRASLPRWATQSGPMLVIDGAIHPAIRSDGPSRLIRNGVGVRDHHSAVFAISEEPVSFGRFARLFRDELRCRDALYLDGVVSSLWDPAMGRVDARAPLGPMVVALEKSTS